MKTKTCLTFPIALLVAAVPHDARLPRSREKSPLGPHALGERSVPPRDGRRRGAGQRDGAALGPVSRCRCRPVGCRLSPLLPEGRGQSERVAPPYGRRAGHPEGLDAELPGAPDSHPFAGVPNPSQPFYWTATSSAELPSGAWSVNFSTGSIDDGSQTPPAFGVVRARGPWL